MSEIWFIKEGAIDNERYDEFAHRDLALELKAKIEQLGAPLTLSLEAPHGVGKSCVGTLLQQQMTGDNTEFVSIEAWRHAGDSRRKAFLYDVIQQLMEKRGRQGKTCEELKDIQEQIYRTRAHLAPVVDGSGLRQSFDVLREGWPRFWNGFQRFFSSAMGRITAVCVLAPLLCLFIWLFSTAQTSPANAVLGFAAACVALFQFLGLGVFLVALAGLGSKVIPQWLEASRVTVTTTPPSSSEQFETLFRDSLDVLKRERQGQNKEPRTLIIFVDELDRLPEAEIIEALNVLRAFRDVKPCVVIVALDEAIVKRALRARTSESAGAIKDDVEAEEFLNKFFKLRQHLPPVVVQEMGDFARALIAKGRLTGGVGALKGVELDVVLDSLVHPGVATPRHLIRLLNAFNSDLHLAQCRESNTDKNILRPGSLTKHLPFLALLTALREDFGHFHATMTTNSELLQAMDAGLENRFDDEWKAGFPDYITLCAHYFASETDGDVTKTAWDTPHSSWRALILHLRATRRHHRTEVAPFIFFRQDVAARSLGSEEARALREELASNFTAGLRTRLEADGAPFARLVATVAERALVETRAAKRANVIAALCDLWETLAPLLEESKVKTLAYEIARLVDEDAELLPFVKSISPLDLLEVLSLDHQDYHQKRCIHAQIVRLGIVISDVDAGDISSEAESPEALETGSAILDGVLLHSEIVAPSERGKIAEFTAWLITQLTLEELVPWLRKARDGAASPLFVPGFFGAKFVDELFEALKLGEAKDVTAEVTLASREFLMAIEDTARAMWGNQWLENCLALREAKTWAMRDLALEFLARQLRDVPEAEAAKTTLQVISTSSAEKRDSDKWNSFATFLRALTDKHHSAAWDDKSIEALDTLGAKMVVLEAEDLRVGLYELLKVLAPSIQENGTLPTTFAALIQYITDEAPDPKVDKALELAFLWHESGEQTDWNTFYQTISAPLESLSSSTQDQITFGINAFALALRQGAPEVAFAAASGRFTALLSLLSSGSYTPDSLTPLAPLFDQAIPIWEATPAQLTAYLSGLNTLLTSSRTEGGINFVASRLDVLREKEADELTLSSTYKQALTASFVVKWPLLKTADSRQLVEQLLVGWIEDLPQASAELFAEQQIAHLTEDYKNAWQSLSSLWLGLTLETRVEALTAVWTTGEETDALGVTARSALQKEVLRSLSSSELALPDDELLPLIVAIERKFHRSILEPLVLGLASACGDETRQTVAGQLLATYQSKTDSVEFKNLLAAVVTIQTQPLPDAWPGMQRLLGGADKEKAAAIELMDGFQRSNPLAEPQKAELAQVLAPSTQVATGAELTKWINRLQGWDLMRFEETQQALRANLQGRERSRAPQDKADRGAIKQALMPFRPSKNRDK